MKKRIGMIALLFVFLYVGICQAAGTVVQTEANYPDSGERHVIFTCTGSADDGSIPNTATNDAVTGFIKGYRLYQVDAYPTSGGTAPDAASVFILDANSLDLLGSEDGSTTAYQGLNLIHATLKRTTFPDAYIPRAGAHAFYHPLISGALTLKVIDQATHSANYTVVLKLYNPKY